MSVVTWIQSPVCGTLNKTSMLKSLSGDTIRLIRNLHVKIEVPWKSTQAIREESKECLENKQTNKQMTIGSRKRFLAWSPDALTKQNATYQLYRSFMKERLGRANWLSMKVASMGWGFELTSVMEGPLYFLCPVWGSGLCWVIHHQMPRGGCKLPSCPQWGADIHCN